MSHDNDKQKYPEVDAERTVIIEEDLRIYRKSEIIDLNERIEHPQGFQVPIPPVDETDSGSGGGKP